MITETQTTLDDHLKGAPRNEHQPRTVVGVCSEPGEPWLTRLSEGPGAYMRTAVITIIVAAGKKALSKDRLRTVI